jgi:hypothetical protein
MVLKAYDEALRAAGHEPITTEVEPAAPFYYAENDDQQYLHKVPNALHCASSAPAFPAGSPRRFLSTAAAAILPDALMKRASAAQSSQTRAGVVAATRPTSSRSREWPCSLASSAAIGRLP